jgi:hypothetical protein
MRTLCILSIGIASAALASPPPPPPEYIWADAKVLIAPTGSENAKLASLFADDVTAFQNGAVVAKGRTAWLKWRAKVWSGSDRVLGFSESSAASSDSGGDVMVVDTFDTVDRANLTPGFVADPRWATRSTLYQFGPDHLIHFVRISRIGGFWMTPPSP